MSVRRLAEDAVQPQGFAFSEENAAWAERVISRYPDGRQQSAVIPLLMRAQDQDGWVTRAAIEHVADRLKMPLIRVLEVATFYTQFQLKPVGTRAHVQVCGTTPCMLRGSDDLKAVCRSKIHPEQFHLNDDGTLSWEEVECLGACVNAPMVMIFKDTYEDLTPQRLEEIIDLFAEGRGGEVQPGPQIDRHGSEPFGGLTSLNSDAADKGAEGGATGGPAQTGASEQAAGAGGAAATPPSQAGRPDTHAAETDPTIASPGRSVGAAADQRAENGASTNPSAGAHRPGSGQTGGQRQGPTGAADKERPEITTANARGDAGRTDGSLPSQERRAEESLIPAKSRPGEPSGSSVSAHGPLLSEGDRGEQGTEAGRLTEDTLPGPMASDHFASKAEGAAEDEAGTLETRPHHSIGQKPGNLLKAPDGAKDDLKQIRGVGPVLEQKLNELGVFHVRQIAAWNSEELFWIDDHLNFRGRAVRDRWIDQAKALAGQSSSSTVG
ncbi:NADH-quinone oxidoreductase subunit NuoE [Mangrovicella endophytica]|uniref:NADH-quinone oxidoreductase subunit NuoE n=1 Tax=Mangrovicella endophytica TaxID=2066697 RepID=UPI000C9DD023|nr:NADH-quinone oxidoreductase subunit NuoE [Mangrovicella endophytica]